MRDDRRIKLRLPDNRYEKIKQDVVNMYEKNDIRCIPIDCFEICQKMCIKLIKYSILTNDTLASVLKSSEDGFCIQTLEVFGLSANLQWYIYYNDNMPYQRIRFTIMHEIGHIVLDHTEHSELAESEANFFAKYALAPPPLVHKTNPEDYLDIAITFNLSDECAYYAMKTYNNWLRFGSNKFLDYELSLLLQFENAI